MRQMNQCLLVPFSIRRIPVTSFGYNIHYITVAFSVFELACFNNLCLLNVQWTVCSFIVKKHTFQGIHWQISLLLVVDMNFSRGIFVIGASLEK